MRVVTLRGRVSFWDHFVRGSVVIIFLRDVVRISCIFSFLSLLDTLFLYMRSCDHLQTYIVLIFTSILLMYVFLYLPFHVLFLFSIYTHASYYLYTIYYFYFTQRCLDKFCLNFTYPFMCCFFSLFIPCFLLFVCNLLFLFHTKMP